MTPARVLAGLALVASGVVPGAPVGAHAAGCAAVGTRGSWTAVASPFDDPEVPTYLSNGRAYEASPYSTVGGQFLSDFAVDPDLPSRVFVTDGVSIQRSLDGGCTWTKVYSTADVDAGAHGLALRSHIVDLHAAHTGLPAAKQVFYALVMPSYASITVNASGTTAQVAVSTDGGATWATRPGPACGEGRLAFAPSRPATVYVDCWGNTGETLSVSTDTGLHWTARTPKVFATTWQKGGLAVSPVNPDEVWAAGMAYVAQYQAGWVVYRSVDGGRSFRNLMTSRAHDSFYEIGLALGAGPGRKTVALAWNADTVGVYQAGAWRFLSPPTPSGQVGAVEYAAYGADTGHVFVVAGYGVVGGDDIYPYSPTCGEGQRALVYDLGARRWRFVAGPVLEPPHTSTAWFHLESVPSHGGVDYWVRESGYREGDCLANEGSATTGLRHSFLLRYRDTT